MAKTVDILKDKWRREFYRRFNISDFEMKNGKLYINQDVDLSGRGLTSMPFKIHTINGNLKVNGNKFQTTEGFPKIINGDLDLSYNKMRTFEEFPLLSGILLLDKNEIHSLKGINKVNKIFSISNNITLSTLSYAPIIENFDIESFFADNTGIHPAEIKIYTECMKQGKWNPLENISDNALKIDSLKKSLVELSIPKYGL